MEDRLQDGRGFMDLERRLASDGCVMAGLVPAIHALVQSRKKDVDARHKAGHVESYQNREPSDGGSSYCSS
jgi:hypothetical protein